MDSEARAIIYQQWYETVLEANRSTLTKKEWCRQNGVHPKTFYYWQRKIRQNEAKKLTEIIPGRSAVSDKHQGLSASLVTGQTDEQAAHFTYKEEASAPLNCGMIPELLLQAGSYQMLIGRGITEETLETVLRAIANA